MAAAEDKRPKSSLESRQAVNKWCALIIPLLLIGAVGYATWVVVVLICVNYLLNPGPNTNVEPRPGAAAAIIAVYFLLLFPMAATYIRAVSLTALNPGYVPQGAPSHHLQRVFVEEPILDFEWPCCPASFSSSDSEKKRPNLPGWYIHTLDLDGIFRGDVPPPPGMEAFYTRDVFQCDPNGLPIWCGTCRNWKPDRAHHCSDVGRCVRKLDHFCPWVGGVVGETNFKFFVQFNCYTVLFTAFVTAVVGVFIAEQVRVGSGMVNVTWIIVIALSGLFLLFTLGMAGKSIQDTCMGLTTVDAIDHSKRTVFMAVKLKRGQVAPRPESNAMEGHEPGEPRDIAVPWQGTIAYPFYTKGQPQQSERPRETFAILCTPPGLNPWNLGLMGNFKAVMGDSVLDWFLPLKMSPCCDHDRGDSMYSTGPAFQQLLIDAGIEEAPKAQRRRRRRPSERSRRDDMLSEGSKSSGEGDRVRHERRDRARRGSRHV